MPFMNYKRSFQSPPALLNRLGFTEFCGGRRTSEGQTIPGIFAEKYEHFSQRRPASSPYDAGKTVLLSKEEP